MIDHIGFIEFCAALQPLYKRVSQNTLKNEMMKEYREAKGNTMKLLSKNQSRIAITTNMWTASNQNKGYMTITTHFIDDSWTLQSRLVRFIYVPVPHTSKVLANVLVQCLMDWNIDRNVSTLTVDNCTTNDVMVERILDNILPKSLILGGQLFHMRCCAHILNLIVKDGLSIISGAIEKIRESVHFWTATPKREEKFIETCGQMSIPFSKKLVLDCKTRWNSTFLMLQVAIQYKIVFDRLEQRDNQYKVLPSENDWNMASDICQKLELFYDVTLLFSGTLYPTANILFPKVCEIKLALVDWLSCPSSIIHLMASSMMAKFDKHWGVINGVMVVGTLLDPRYKIDLLDYFFPQIYGHDSDVEIEKVKTIFQNYNDSNCATSKGASQGLGIPGFHVKGKELIPSSLNSNPNQVDVSSLGRKEAWRSNFEKHKSAKRNDTSNLKLEFDRYLEEATLPDSDEKFHILVWWKAKGLKYPTLQMIARDFLAIPISTIASESSFSTGGWFLTPHRSRLRPDTLEALMCLQDWLWNEMEGNQVYTFN
uniref:AC transposase n=1 Tax=Cajanus cajan TaxID=3821 RepID=A0A151RKP0_CAJCA|nr:Putative AC transposase [Cajanus cajan]